MQLGGFAVDLVHQASYGREVTGLDVLADFRGVPKEPSHCPLRTWWDRGYESPYLGHDFLSARPMPRRHSSALFADGIQIGSEDIRSGVSAAS